MVTQKDIAKALGISQYTVSKALKNSTRISEETRKNVHAKAEELGYRPNPLVSALMASRRNRKGVDWKGKLAIIGGRSLEEWCEWPVGRDVYDGILQRAYELGFSIDFFNIDDVDTNRQRLVEIIKARGTSGILFGSFNNNGTLGDLDFSDLACVATCRSLVEPRVNMVTNHIAYSMRKVLHEVTRKGHKRVGLVTAAEMSEYNDREWIALYLDYQNQLPAEQRVNYLSLHDHSYDTIRNWFIENDQPGMILVDSYNDKAWVQKAIESCRVSPEFALMLGHSSLPSMGIYTSGYSIGSKAVELLVGNIQIGKTGYPEDVSVTMIEGRWFDNSQKKQTEPLDWVFPKKNNVPVDPWSKHEA